MTTGKAWTDQELELITHVYAAMLFREKISRAKFNKAAIRRATLPQLEGRSAGSYEMKMQNISAAMRDAGEPWIAGYKPLKGYQRSLKEIAANAWHNITEQQAEFCLILRESAGSLK